jgi:2-polyprenyl-6-methoxyphenol hydroxylase-like FAD-dependent oxidoreductase
MSRRLFTERRYGGHNIKLTWYRTRFIDKHGRPFAPFPVRVGSKSSITAEHEILRGDLAKLLYDTTVKDPQITYRFGTFVDQILSNDDHSVKVAFNDGSKHEYDILVAADGQWSNVRRQTFDPSSIKIIDKGSYVAYWTGKRTAADNDWWNIHQALRARVVTCRPDPNGTIRVAVSFMPTDDASRQAWRSASRSDRKTQEALVKSEFKDVGWETKRFLEDMSQAPDFYFQSIQQVRMKKWSKGRVICLGDAAYAPTPLTGMGTSLAIHGAHLLATELNKLGPDQHPAGAFDAYESKFRPTVEKIQSIPFFIPGIAHPASVWHRSIFSAFVTIASKIMALFARLG